MASYHLYAFANYHTQVMGVPQRGLAVFPHYTRIPILSLVIYKVVSHIYALIPIIHK
jgi:hypothetical protein